MKELNSLELAFVSGGWETNYEEMPMNVATAVAVGLVCGAVFGISAGGFSWEAAKVGAFGSVMTRFFIQFENYYKG